MTSIPSAAPSFLNKLSRRTENKNSSSRSMPISPKIGALEGNAFDDIPPSNNSDTKTPEARNSPLQPQTISRGRQKDQGQLAHNNAELYQQQLEEDLRTESAQLTTTLIASNDLDSVQHMETRMVEITTLIGQFSNLVQNQQEQVEIIHENAKETKENLDKGQENLIDAAERTKKSKHYKAWSIIAMASVLMFFQILRN